MPFRNRIEAGRRLAQALEGYRSAEPVLLALPRGGVPVAGEVAAALGAPVDLVVVRKIGVPDQPELAMGAVVDGADPLVVRNEDVIRMAGIDQATFDRVCAGEIAEIARRRRAYLGERPHPDLAGRTAIVVDDGIATGATTRAALRAVRRQKPKRLVLAVPVAPPDTVEALAGEADDIVCLEQPVPFMAIGAFYGDFRPVPDDEVRAVLARFPPHAKAASRAAE